MSGSCRTGFHWPGQNGKRRVTAARSLPREPEDHGLEVQGVPCHPLFFQSDPKEVYDVYDLYTSFGSGKYVNRIPADNGSYDGYECSDCQYTFKPSMNIHSIKVICFKEGSSLGSNLGSPRLLRTFEPGFAKPRFGPTGLPAAQAVALRCLC